MVKDRAVLRLTARIVHAGGSDGIGLPIGNLTSQWLCNLTLDRLDHHVKEVLRIPGYVRYMDDFVLFARAKPGLHAAHEAVRGFLGDSLRLELKDAATVLAPVREGVPFLGWRLYRGTQRLRGQNLRRLRARVRQRCAQHAEGVLDEEALLASLRSVCEHLRHGATLGLRRRWLRHIEVASIRAPPDR